MLINPRELIGPLLWDQSRAVKIVMLAGFFDDSGTHTASQVAVWGGLFGPLDEFEKLDAAWRGLLSAPIDGKPPLSKFSLAECIAGEGEFSHYNKASRDHVRYRFRHLFDDLDVAPIACAVDAGAWNSLISAQTRSFLGEPHLKAFDGCLETACGFAASMNEHISLHFDAGQLDRSTRAVWPVPGFEDTELGVFMEPEVGHGTTEVYAGVQA